MRVALFVSLMVIGGCAAVADGGQPAGELPAGLRDRLQQERFGVVTSIRGLPLGVRDELTKMFGGSLDIAEPDAPFRSSGGVNDPLLPTRRLVAAACSQELCIVSYERAGIARLWVALLHWTPAETRLEWGGHAPAGLRTAEAVRAALLSGAVQSSKSGW